MGERTLDRLRRARALAGIAATLWLLAATALASTSITSSSPGKPAVVHLAEQNGRFQLWWQAADSSDNVTATEVHYRHTDGSLDNTLRQASFTHNSVTYTPGNGARVQFRIRFINSSGEGPWSDFLEGETGPEALDASNITYNSVRLTLSKYEGWGHPGNPSRQARGDWSYKYTSPVGGQCTNVAKTSGTEVTVTNLNKSTEYVFKAYSGSNCQTVIATADAFTTSDMATQSGGGPTADQGTVLDRARETVRRVLNRTLAAVGTRTLTSALGNIGTRLADDAPGMGLTLAGLAVPLGAGGLPGAADNRTAGMEELFRTSAFSVRLGAADDAGASPAGLLWSLWGRGDFGSFEGRPESGASYSGEMRTAWLGFDGRAGPWVSGVAVSHGESETEYRSNAGAGRLETQLTAVYPYGRWTLSDGLELRGVLGVGSGETRHTPQGGAAETSALSMRMVSTGVRRALPAPEGLELAARADASVVRMEIGDGPEIVSGVSADSWRFRAGLEASRLFALEGVAALEPFAEAAGRRDGGDGVTGMGLEVAGGVRYTAPDLQVEARGRWLAAHSEEGARERGVSLTARVGPGAQGRGLSLSLSPRWGARTGAAEALWGDDLPGRADAATAGGLDARIGYGFAPGPGNLLTPFAEMDLTGGEGRRLRLGTRFEAWHPDLALELSGERHESGGARPEHGMRLEFRLRF